MVQLQYSALKRKHLCQYLRITLLFKEKKPAKKRERVSSLDDTFRIASILQKSVSTGRSSYVEMSKVNQIISFNMKSHIDSIKREIMPDAYKGAIELFSQLSYYYERTITPNGSIRIKEFNKLLAFDSEIALQLHNLKSSKRISTNIDDFEYIENLKDLIKERKDFIDSIKA